MPKSLTVARFSLKEWLLEHKEQFVTYTQEEIADIAIMVGYSAKDVAEWITKKDRRYI